MVTGVIVYCGNFFGYFGFYEYVEVFIGRFFGFEMVCFMVFFYF